MATRSGKKKIVKKKSASKNLLINKKKIKKVAPKKKVAKKIATKVAPKTKKATKKKVEPKRAVKLEMPELKHLAPVDANSEEKPRNTSKEDPINIVDQKAFEKFTSKSDPHQHLYLSPKAKGSIKPTGKKPLWNK